MTIVAGSAAPVSAGLLDPLGDDVGQGEADLAAAGQLDIALGEELGVDQGAVLDPQAPVDPEAGAQRVEAVLGAGMPGAGDLQRVDHPGQADERMAAIVELVVEEAEIEAGIVRDQRTVAEEFEQVLAPGRGSAACRRGRRR